MSQLKAYITQKKIAFFNELTGLGFRHAPKDSLVKDLLLLEDSLYYTQIEDEFSYKLPYYLKALAIAYETKLGFDILGFKEKLGFEFLARLPLDLNSGSLLEMTADAIIQTKESKHENKLPIQLRFDNPKKMSLQLLTLELGMGYQSISDPWTYNLDEAWEHMSGGLYIPTRNKNLESFVEYIEEMHELFRDT